MLLISFSVFVPHGVVGCNEQPSLDVLGTNIGTSIANSGGRVQISDMNEISVTKLLKEIALLTQITLTNSFTCTNTDG